MGWTILKWTWRVAVNVFYLAVTAYVLNALQGRTERIIVPILGALYVVIRTIGPGLYFMFMTQMLALDTLETEIRTVANPAYRPDDEAREVFQKRMRDSQARFYLDAVFLTLISLLCLFTLFTAL